MPDKVDDETQQTKINEMDILNLVLAEDNKIFWWIGLEPPVNETNYSADGVRKVILQHTRANPKMMVLIKPKDESRYENMVNILDEMDITDTKRYAIVEYSPDDKAIITGNIPVEEVVGTPPSQ